MPWARLDDRRHENVKLRKAGLEAAGLDSHAITYCAGHLTDGFVDTTIVEMLAGVRHWRKIADRLTEVGRWERDDEKDGWTLVNYLEFNPSREQVETEREEKSKRGRSAANARWNTPRNAEPMHDASALHDLSRGREMPRPDPSLFASKEARRAVAKATDSPGGRIPPPPKNPCPKCEGSRWTETDAGDIRCEACHGTGEAA